jgi:2'-5' RNA ligase
VRPEGIHLTRKFLGEGEAARRPGIEAALVGPARAGAPFRLEAAGLGVFPDRGAPRVVWIGVRGDLPAAAALQREVETALRAEGFAPEGRPFRPHLTLGRVRGPGRGDWRTALAGAAEPEGEAFEVREYVLFESRLGPAGAAYAPLARFPLGAPGPS